MHNAASVSASLGSMGLLRLVGVSWPWSLAAGLGVYLGTRSWKYFYIAARTAKRDLIGLYVLLRVKLALWRYMRSGSNIPSIFTQTVKLHPNKPALIYEATGETWTFTQLDEISNAVAHWARGQGWVSGDVVALFLESRPLHVALWLGLAKVGVEAALINFSLRCDPLLHCIGVSGSRAIVFGAELADGCKNNFFAGRDISYFTRTYVQNSKEFFIDISYCSTATSNFSDATQEYVSRTSWKNRIVSVYSFSSGRATHICVLAEYSLQFV